MFWDRDELPTSSNLGQDIEDALEKSRYLIVICSLRTPLSKWVRQEIDTFRTIHGDDRILALLIEGEPDQSFADNLRHISKVHKNQDGTLKEVLQEIEPLAADIRPEEIKNNPSYEYDVNSPLGKRIFEEQIRKTNEQRQITEENGTKETERLEP